MVIKTKFFVVCFCSLFALIVHKASCLLRNEELTNSNVLVTQFMHSVRLEQFFFALHFQPRPTDWAKEGLIVV